MKIREVKRFSKKVYQAVNRLLPQLDPESETLTEEKFRKIIRSECTHFFIAEEDNKEISGILSAVVYHIPTGTKFWIEDVVVDEAFRGKGIGKALMLSAMELANQVGTKSVDLTSRPYRIAANRLYQELGFELRETNVYRYSLKQ
jgi:ribosomal protein S18 acetylase RimI-like enzyme